MVRRKRAVFSHNQGIDSSMFETDTRRSAETLPGNMTRAVCSSRRGQCVPLTVSRLLPCFLSFARLLITRWRAHSLYPTAQFEDEQCLGLIVSNIPCQQPKRLSFVRRWQAHLSIRVNNTFLLQTQISQCRGQTHPSHKGAARGTTASSFDHLRGRQEPYSRKHPFRRLNIWACYYTRVK